MLKAHQVSLGDPQALAFLKNVLEDWNCTGKSADQGEHKVKTAPTGERQDANG